MNSFMTGTLYKLKSPVNPHNNNLSLFRKPSIKEKIRLTGVNIKSFTRPFHQTNTNILVNNNTEVFNLENHNEYYILLLLSLSHRGGLIQQLPEMFLLLLGKSLHMFCKQFLLLMSLQQSRRLPPVIFTQIAPCF